MLRLQAHADKAPEQVGKARDAGEQAEEERRVEGAGVAKDMGQDAVCEDLDSLRVAHSALAVVLDTS